LALLPPIAIFVALSLNRLANSVDVCTPFLDGCVSISRAVRASPGLPWFRFLILPCCAVLPLTFYLIAQQYFPFSRMMQRCANVAALFLLLYVCFLGSDGAFYQWLRRLGIVFFFAGAGLAQLFFARCLSTRQTPAAISTLRWLRLLGAAMLLLALLHLVIKHGFPLQEPIENISEWWLAFLLCCGFALISYWLANDKFTDGARPSVLNR
jgi:hypothetical protein